MASDTLVSKAPVVDTAPKKKKKNKISRRDNNWHGWLFIGPYALIFSVWR